MFRMRLHMKFNISELDEVYILFVDLYGFSFEPTPLQNSLFT